MPKLAAVNAALLCMKGTCWKSGIPDKTFEMPLLFTYMTVRQITKSSSHKSCSKKIPSHLSLTFRTLAGIKKSIRQTERRGGEYVID